MTIQLRPFHKVKELTAKYYNSTYYSLTKVPCRSKKNKTKKKITSYQHKLRLHPANVYYKKKRKTNINAINIIFVGIA